MSDDFRPYFVYIKKEEEKGDKFAKMCMEVKTAMLPEPVNPFVRKSVFTQTYPTCLIPATPRRTCCFYTCS